MAQQIMHASQATNLADILERVLDKGIVIAGDIRIPDLLTWSPQNLSAFAVDERPAVVCRAQPDQTAELSGPEPWPS